MRIKLFFLFILVIQQSYSQNELRATVVGKKAKEPIEYAAIYNKSDYTFSNEEGKFLFITGNNFN